MTRRTQEKYKASLLEIWFLQHSHTKGYFEVPYNYLRNSEYFLNWFPNKQKGFCMSRRYHVIRLALISSTTSSMCCERSEAKSTCQFCLETKNKSWQWTYRWRRLAATWNHINHVVARTLYAVTNIWHTNI